MLLRSGTQIQSGDASCLLRSTPSGQLSRYMAGHTVTAKAGTAQLTPKHRNVSTQTAAFDYRRGFTARTAA